MEEVSDDSEWEYEYDTNEKEKFFVTLDLSSFSRSIRPPFKSESVQAAVNSSSDLPWATPHQTNDANADANLDPSLAPVSEDPILPSREAQDNAELNAARPTPIQQEIRSPDDFQILDLHTLNPLIADRSHFYSCQWSSTLGTDVFLSAPSLPPPSEALLGDESSSTKPLRSYPGVDLLATSRIRLTARPFEAIPRPRSATHMNEAFASSSTVENDEPEIQIPIPATAPISRQKQAAFLSKLMNIKRQRGETDEVTVTVSSRTDIRPEERRRGLATAYVGPGYRVGERDPGRRKGRARGWRKAPSASRGVELGRTSEDRGEGPGGTGIENVATPERWADLDERVKD